MSSANVRDGLRGRGRRYRTAGLAGGVVVLLAIALGLSGGGEPSRWALFAGRFHPLVVHFPIALLVLAAVLEAAARWVRPLRAVRWAVPFVLALGAASTLGAALAGYLLSLEGGYDPELVDRHMGLGIAVGVGALLALGFEAAARKTRSARLRSAYVGLLTATVVLLVWTGHLGASLTHGPEYLTEYMPPAVKRLAGMAAVGGSEAGTIVDPDSARIYDDLVRPILERRCVACHGEQKVKGRLRLDAPEGIRVGGRNGPVVVAGRPNRSELLRRVTLPPDHEDAMPPDGLPPLTIGETEVLRWWIAQGASFALRVGAATEVSPPVQTLLARLAGPRAARRTGLYALQVPAADTAAVAALRAAGLDVRRMAHDLELLQVTAATAGKGFTDADVQRLRAVAPQIAWLDLGRTAVTDTAMATIATMPHLTRLHLEHTAVTDAGLARLAELEHLAYLNLYGTAVTDAGLRHLEGLAGLRALYLWRTAVTEEAARQLRARRPRLYVDTGAPLAAADSTARNPEAVAK